MKNVRRRSIVGWVVILGAFLALTLAACSSDSGGQPDSGGAEMRLTANGCVADCAFASDEEFTLAVEIVAIPAGGYIAAQSFIDYGPDLTYIAAETSDEIIWPDCESAVALKAETAPMLVNHGCLTGLLTPLPASVYVGNLVELAFKCSTDSSTTEVRLLPEDDLVAKSSGAAFVGKDMATHYIPDITDLTIICGS